MQGLIFLSPSIFLGWMGKLPSPRPRLPLFRQGEPAWWSSWVYVWPCLPQACSWCMGSCDATASGLASWSVSTVNSWNGMMKISSHGPTQINSVANCQKNYNVYGQKQQQLDQCTLIIDSLQIKWSLDFCWNSTSKMAQWCCFQNKTVELKEATRRLNKKSSK